MLTVYQVLKESGIVFTPADISIIGIWVRNSYIARFGVQPPKINQVEDGVSYRVFGYNDSYKDEITKTISDYFSLKAKTIGGTLDAKTENKSTVERLIDIQNEIHKMEKKIIYQKVGKRKRTTKLKIK